MPPEVKPDIVQRLEAAGFDLVNKKRDRALCMLVIAIGTACEQWHVTTPEADSDRRLEACVQSLNYLGFELSDIEAALGALTEPEEGVDDA